MKKTATPAGSGEISQSRLTLPAYTSQLRQQWIGSGRQRPCPVCGRNTDDKCRWTDTTINCHQGDSFAPPRLRIGDVLQIEGRPWAVVSISGGFSGLATVFKPHQPRKGGSRRSKSLPVRQVDLKPSAQKLLAMARRHVQACLAMPELQYLSLVELERYLAHARSTATNLKAIRRPLLQARQEQPELGRFLDVVSIWQKAIGYQLQDIERFFRLELGTPTTAQIEAPGAEVVR